MSQFSGKTVVVSGGAEGIGFAIARAMGKQGMNVVLGDIDTNQLNIAKTKLIIYNKLCLISVTFRLFVFLCYLVILKGSNFY